MTQRMTVNRYLEISFMFHSPGQQIVTENPGTEEKSRIGATYFTV